MEDATPYLPAPPAPGRAVRVSTFLSRTQALVVLPTLNEEHGLDRTLGELPFGRLGDPNYHVQVMVIDGGSTDRTVAVARKWGVPVFRQRGSGKGAAVVEAVRWARAHGVSHVVVLDADATYPASSILPALNLLREGSELVVGVRRPTGGPPRRVLKLIHRIGNIALSYTASLLARQTVFDICSGFWGVSTARFEELEVGAHEFAIEAELVLKALRAGLEVTQIPIDYRDRIGEAKLHIVRDGGSILLSIVQYGRRARPSRRPGFVPGVPARELLSIGLIAEARTAVLECPPEEFQLANRIGLLLNRALPRTSVRVRAPPSAAAPSALQGPGDRPPALFVTLPPPGGRPSDRGMTVAIEPHAKSLTIRMGQRGPGPDRPVAPDHEPHFVRDLARRIAAARLHSVIGSVTSRMNFDPGEQQRSLLRANGFSVARPTDDGAARPGGGP
jgi:hypothetical protein